MIDFIAYFSTAQDELGYVVLERHGTVPANFLGGPALPSGTYRLEGGVLVPVREEPSVTPTGGAAPQA